MRILRIILLDDGIPLLVRCVWGFELQFLQVSPYVKSKVPCSKEAGMFVGLELAAPSPVGREWGSSRGTTR